MHSSKWLDRGACPKCGSSDAKVQHSKGHSYCFSCNTRFGEEKDMKSPKSIKHSELFPGSKKLVEGGLPSQSLLLLGQSGIGKTIFCKQFILARERP